MSTKYTITVEVEVADIWTEDGLDLTSENWRDALKEAIQDLHHVATSSEFKISQPKVRKHRHTK